MKDSTKEELEQLIEQAAAFARSGDYTGAVARAQWAYEQIQRHAEGPHADPALGELLRSAEHGLAEYRRLVRRWQEENARRYAAYVSRELSAINTFAEEEDEPGGRRSERQEPLVGAGRSHGDAHRAVRET